MVYLARHQPSHSVRLNTSILSQRWHCLNVPKQPVLELQYVTFSRVFVLLLWQKKTHSPILGDHAKWFSRCQEHHRDGGFLRWQQRWRPFSSSRISKIKEIINRRIYGNLIAFGSIRVLLFGRDEIVLWCLGVGNWMKKYLREIWCFFFL